MPRRSIDMEPLRTLPKTIEAAYFNRARLALIRVGNPLRLTLPGLRGLEAIVSDDNWLVLDSQGSGNPVLAWCDFEAASRNALHKPVRCQLKLYHIHAGLIMGPALEALQSALQEILAPTAQPVSQDDQS